MNNKDIAKEWLDMAESDLDSAIFLLNMKPQPLEIICYHCQQSAEKYLKGFIALNGGPLQKTHDLLLLNKECCIYEKKFMEIVDNCINLTDYGVQVRYPFNIEIEESDMKAAISDAKDLAKFVRRIVD